MSVLADRLLAVHEGLNQSDIPHAFGGAIALAYCTKEPRGTRDLDVNVFVAPDRADEVFEAMPAGVRITQTASRDVAREGQVRLMWDETPVDLFFAVHDFHQDAARTVVEVPFEGTTIPVISCDALIVFKAMYDRTRDWADIEAILEAEATDGHRALRRLRSLLESPHPAIARLGALLEDDAL